MPKQLSVTDDQVIHAYQASMSGQKVAQALGIGLTTVLRILARHNVPRIGHTEYLKTKSTEKYTGVYTGSHQDVVDFYTSGLSMKDISNKIGRSVSVVQRILRNSGVESRPYGGSGSQHSMWTGGVLPAGDGYLKEWIALDDPMSPMRGKGGYVKQHRLIMARKLGRPLLDSETVHHKDGDRANNDPANLELRQGKHGKHVVMCCMDCGSHNIGHAPLNG